MNLVGDAYGYLTVVDEAYTKLYIEPKTGKRHFLKYWKCICSCGKENVIVSQSNLRGGSVTSCGCFRRDRASKLNKKENIYDLSKDYGIGWTTNSNKEFYFDKEDYEKIKDYTWYEGVGGYIYTSRIKNGEPKYYQLHNIVMDNYQNNYLCKNIDHINGNIKDNRKQNLRLVTRSQNNMNRKISKNNTTGIKGVSYYKKRNKWIVNLSSKNDNIRIYKEFNDKEKAINYRREIENKYFGEYNRKE